MFAVYAHGFAAGVLIGSGAAATYIRRSIIPGIRVLEQDLAAQTRFGEDLARDLNTIEAERDNLRVLRDAAAAGAADDLEPADFA